MPERFSRVEIYGLRKLGTVYFPDFSKAGGEQGIGALAETLEAGERRDLHLLLRLAAILPPAVIRQLFLAENEDRNGLLVRILAPLHVQIKGLCGLLYFHAASNTKEGPDG